ncbi:hypothetical protein BGZ94_008592 [Podila epigama]|nr:hypothetical protein BGZ94_008592 [Podila epigama]
MSIEAATASPEVASAASPTVFVNRDATVSNHNINQPQIIDHLSPQSLPEQSLSPPSSPKIRPSSPRIAFKKIIATFSPKDSLDVKSQATGPLPTPPPGDDEIPQDKEEVTVVTFSTMAITTNSASASSPSTTTAISEIQKYPGTINAKFVRDQSKIQNLDGLRHALRAAIEKSSAAKLAVDGGILTSANHKKWYLSSLPVNWIQKISSEYRFGNYVIVDRKTSATVWEDMPIYARIGMHLVFACVFDHKLFKSSKVRKLFHIESVNQGRHFDAPESVAQIPYFIKAYKLDLSELLQPNINEYPSFNAFFYRQLKPDARPIYAHDDPNIIVSAADCRLCVYESISTATQVWIKGKTFSIPRLVRDDALAAQFEGGSLAIFRLAPQDYHRFHSPVQGTVVSDPNKITGTYYTVNPMAVNDCIDVFTENVRKVSVIALEQSESERNAQFDQCVFVSIGALLVGSIELTGAGKAGNRIVKGDELGYFAYGGSTCILLFKKDAVKFDQDLVTSSLGGVETLVRMGERIGSRATTNTAHKDLPKVTGETMVQPQEDTSHPPNVILNQALDSDTELDNNHRTASPSRATTLQEGRVLKSGYLMKKGERLKEYELLRIVDFRDLHRAAEVSAKHKENVFVILTPRRTFTVQAKNHADMQDWIDAINEVKAQFEFTSSSDLESFAGSTLQLGLQQQQQSSNASGSIPGAVTVNRLSKPTLRKLGSGMALPRRHRYTGSNGSSTHVNRVTMGDVVNHVGISMAGATNATPELHTNSTRPKDKSKATKNTALAGYKKKKKNIPAPLFLPPPPSKQFQETTEILNTPTTSPRRCSSVFMASLQQAHRTEDSSPLPTSSNTTQQLSNAQADDGATLPSPAVSTTVVSVSASETKNAPRKAHTTAITTTSVSGSPSSPGNHSGGEETFWATTDHNNLSSGEDEIHEEDENNPCFLEAGRVASEANAPGSGVISAEELGNKVVRQGYLLKLDLAEEMVCFTWG